MAYNCWYTDTYESILKLAQWSDLTADIEKKMVCVFSWMPQTIMAVRHAGGRCKHEIHSAQSTREVLGGVKDSFERIKGFSLSTFIVAEYAGDVEALCRTLFPILGSVGASKYLHFSCPGLLPMWDRRIRMESKCKDSVAGYVQFLERFKQELQDEYNRQAALQKYPTNVVRGWDIVRMERRSKPAKRIALRRQVKKRAMPEQPR